MRVRASPRRMRKASSNASTVATRLVPVRAEGLVLGCPSLRRWRRRTVVRPGARGPRPVELDSRCASRGMARRGAPAPPEPRRAILPAIRKASRSGPCSARGVAPSHAASAGPGERGGARLAASARLFGGARVYLTRAQPRRRNSQPFRNRFAVPSQGWMAGLLSCEHEATDTSPLRTPWWGARGTSETSRPYGGWGPSSESTYESPPPTWRLRKPWRGCGEPARASVRPVSATRWRAGSGAPMTATMQAPSSERSVISA